MQFFKANRLSFGPDFDPLEYDERKNANLHNEITSINFAIVSLVKRYYSKRNCCLIVVKFWSICVVWAVSNIARKNFEKRQQLPDTLSVYAKSNGRKTEFVLPVDDGQKYAKNIEKLGELLSAHLFSHRAGTTNYFAIEPLAENGGE